ncbi:hypothetical protein NST17_19585 [Caldifermentibacillus hisashii]|uniref:Uncharacterized protein n=1 Tax=Caldifermentibacillus hisashii TaxID=996558 RepID=A0ABU9K3H9_9BACI
MIEIKGLEDARKEFNNWQGAAVIFVDFEDMTAWCHVSEIPVYHDDSIIVVAGKDNLYERNNRVGKERLDNIVEIVYKKYKEGWPKEKLEEPMYYSTDEAKILCF